MKDPESPTLNAWRETWLYLCDLMRGSKLPNYIKYSVGEDILRDMMRVGQHINKAHMLINSKPYESRKHVYQASDIYDDVKFAVNQLVDAKHPATNVDNPGSPMLPDRTREYLSKLMDNFGRWLGGWLKNIQSAGSG